MKKTLIKLSIGLLLVFSSASCGDFLDVIPDNIAVIEDAFQTRESTLRFLATLYAYLPPYNGTSNPALVAGDEVFVNDNVSRTWAGRRINRGGQNVVDPALGYWGNNGTVRNLFVALRDCNILLENLDRPFNLTDSERTIWAAEAKFLKAYFHFYLMRMYGPIPVIRENIEVSSGAEAVRVKREPIDDVVNYIVEILDEAIPNLPLVIEDRALELGRGTAVAAAMLKAQVLVTAASPLFNGNTDYANFVDKEGNPLFNITSDNSKWDLASVACKEAIDIAHQAGHLLYTFPNAPLSWSDTTVRKLSVRGSITERWNEEIIWASGTSAVGGLQGLSQAKIAIGLTAENRESTQSYWGPPLHVAEQFYSENGVPINEDKDFDYGNRYAVTTAGPDHRHYVRTGFQTAKLNLNRELRYYASLGFDGGVWFGHGVTNDLNALVVEGKRGQRAGRLDETRYTQSGYWAKKLVYYQNVQQTSTNSYSIRSYPFPLMRLGDLYLLYAEALNESSGPTAAYEWIDKVRERAGLNGVLESWSAHSNNPSKPTSQEGLRQIIHDERMIELIFEGHRFWDLRRWKKSIDFLNRDIQGWNIEGDNTETYYNVITYGKHNFLNRDYLWPIAEFDIISNNNLVQNPGW
ncbi:RagB/SusD family nutrient uptake outer membrane protein [Lunatibacter salilacus]|uniref:RagB/SusD family nutrient uptake outer membrane protein n=1 Tax=Lunatibacter salilacus TaxID=2483804 RepID=UPI00131D0AF2|nr:RagB/SusD family nutrient uptake outer membrane protein [Lunatibacter salilacus]